MANLALAHKVPKGQYIKKKINYYLKSIYIYVNSYLNKDKG